MKTANKMAAGVAMAIFVVTRIAEASPRQCTDDSEQAQALRDQGKLVEAYTPLLRCAQAECPPSVVRDCTTWFGDVEARMPTAIVRAIDAAGHDVDSAHLLLDGRPISGSLGGRAFPINPGEHVVRVVAPDRQPVEQRIFIYEYTRGRIVAVTVPSPSPPPESATREPSDRTRLAWVVGTGALASFGAAAFFWLSAVHEARAVERACDPSCSAPDLAATRRDAIFADVALGVGVGLAIAAGALWLLPRLASRDLRKAAVGLSFGGHASAALWSHAF